MNFSKIGGSAYDVPYQHQTWNHLFFDRIRSVQLEIRLMQSYLVEEEASRSGGAGLSRQIKSLHRCSMILFDDVYMPLRDKWL